MMYPKPRKPIRGTDACKVHMSLVAELGCAVCGARPVEVHHVICGRFSGTRASDFDTIPLCLQHHRHGMLAIHSGKESWVKRYGTDTDFLPIVAQKLLQRFGYVAPERE